MKLTFTMLAMVFCTASFAQLQNGDMETWRTYTSGSSPTLYEPTGWNTVDTIIYFAGPLLCPTCTLTPTTFQTTTSHSGTYAAEIMTKDLGGTIGIVSGELTNCTISFNTSTMKVTQTGGTPVTQRIDSVTAWMELLPYGGDSGSVNIQAVLAGMGAGGTDSVVGNGLDSTTVGASRNNYVLAASAYTRHKYYINYTNATVIPDHIQINFQTSSQQSHDSTTMYVDDINIYPSVPGVSVPALCMSDLILCYPNPASNTIHIQTSQYQNTVATLYNVIGQKVVTLPLQNNITEMDISNLSTGIYLLHLVDKNNTIIYQTKIAKQ